MIDIELVEKAALVAGLTYGDGWHSTLSTGVDAQDMVLFANALRAALAAQPAPQAEPTDADEIQQLSGLVQILDNKLAQYEQAEPTQAQLDAMMNCLIGYVMTHAEVRAIWKAAHSHE